MTLQDIITKHKESLAIALDIAIHEQEFTECHRGFTSDSAMLATWREILEVLEDDL